MLFPIPIIPPLSHCTTFLDAGDKDATASAPVLPFCSLPHRLNSLHLNCHSNCTFQLNKQTNRFKRKNPWIYESSVNSMRFEITLKIQFAWNDIVSFSKYSLHLHRLSSTARTGSFTLKDKDARILQNPGNHLRNNKVSHSKTHESSSVNTQQLKLINSVLLSNILKTNRIHKLCFCFKTVHFQAIH